MPQPSLMNSYVSKRPELVVVFNDLMKSCKIALQQKGKCKVDHLEGLYQGIIHPIAGIWHVGVLKCSQLSKTCVPVFSILSRLLDHPTPSIRRRLGHCVGFDSLRNETMVLVDRLASDRNVNARTDAYWMAVAFERREAKSRIASYKLAESNPKALEQLNEIEKFINDGYLVNREKSGYTTIRAFCDWGYFACHLDPAEMKATTIQKVVEKMGKAKNNSF